MSIKKKTTLKPLKEEISFCTQCGKDLNDISTSQVVEDVSTLRKGWEGCRDSGKFVGDFCSKLFIADDKNLEDIFSKKDEEEDL